MNDEPEVTEADSEEFQKLEKKRKKDLHSVLAFIIINFALIFGIALITFLAVVIMVKFKPEAKKKERQTFTPTVEITNVKLAPQHIIIDTQGTVRAQRQAALTAEVAGEIIKLSPKLETGKQLLADEFLLQIETADYLSAISTAETNVANAELLIAQEEARAKQAKREWKKLGRGEITDLLARKPQLKSARATLAAATSTLAQARRNLERTTIRAPFAATVRQKNVELGTIIAPGAIIATIFTPQDVEIDLPVSLEDLGFLSYQEDGKPAGEITLQGEIGNQTHHWQATVLRTSGEINQRSRTALLIASIQENTANPPNLQLPPPGLFLNAEIKGRELPNIATLPRSALRSDGSLIVVRENQTIEMKTVSIARTTSQTIFVDKGLADGEQICLTRLDTPVSGMKVQIAEPRENTKPEEKE